MAFAVQAVCTIPGSSMHGRTVNLWTGTSLAAAQKWLPRMRAKHAGNNYRDFQAVDLADARECKGDAPADTSR